MQSHEALSCTMQFIICNGGDRKTFRGRFRLRCFGYTIMPALLWDNRARERPRIARSSRGLDIAKSHGAISQIATVAVWVEGAF